MLSLTVCWGLIVLLCIATQIGYLIYWQLPPISRHSQTKEQPSVSIVICTHNHLAALQKGLHTFLTQTYNTFEVIVVDDQSTDGTYDWLQSIHADKLKIIRLDASAPGKKDALATGINAAQYDWIMLTDADCYVHSTLWIHTLISRCEEDKIGYVAYAPYEKETGWLNKLIRYDTAFIAMQYLSMAHKGKAYMGVGRNMGWKRNMRDDLQKALALQTTSSGDDDLLLQRIGIKKDMQAVVHPDTYVFSKPHQTFTNWIRQKSRHHTTGWYYPFSTQLLLMGWFLAGTLHYGMVSVWILFFPSTALVALCTILLRWILIILGRYRAFNILLEKDLIVFSPLLDFIHIFVIPFFTLKSRFQNKKRWM